MIKFNDDKKLKIMQITDIQEIPNVSADTLNLLNSALDKEQPDLVILTGDQIKGYGITYKGKRGMSCIGMLLIQLTELCNLLQAETFRLL